jgi:hypothetical protein
MVLENQLWWKYWQRNLHADEGIAVVNGHDVNLEQKAVTSMVI